MRTQGRGNKGPLSRAAVEPKRASGETAQPHRPWAATSSPFRDLRFPLQRASRSLAAVVAQGVAVRGAVNASDESARHTREVDTKGQARPPREPAREEVNHRPSRREGQSPAQARGSTAIEIILERAPTGSQRSTVRNARSRRDVGRPTSLHLVLAQIVRIDVFEPALQAIAVQAIG